MISHVVKELLLLPTELEDRLVITPMYGDTFEISNPEFLSHSIRFNFSVRDRLSGSYESFHLVKDGALLVKEITIGTRTINFEELLYNPDLDDTPSFDFVEGLVKSLKEEAYLKNSIKELNMLAKKFKTLTESRESLDHSESLEVPKPERREEEVPCVEYTLIYSPTVSHIRTEDYRDLEEVMTCIKSLKQTLQDLRYIIRGTTYLIEFLPRFLPWSVLTPLPRSKKKKYQDLIIPEGVTLRRTEWMDKIKI